MVVSGGGIGDGVCADICRCLHLQTARLRVVTCSPRASYGVSLVVRLVISPQPGHFPKGHRLGVAGWWSSSWLEKLRVMEGGREGGWRVSGWGAALWLLLA